MDVVEQGDGHHRRDVLAGKREQFVGLIQQGVANSEACRIELPQPSGQPRSWWRCRWSKVAGQCYTDVSSST